MPLSRSSTWVAVGVAALTVLGSATSAFADRNMYTHSRMGDRHGYGYHRHMMNPFRFHHRHMMGGYHHRPMHRHMY